MITSREGNGTPLQYFCLENPMDGGAWWAAAHGVTRVGHDWATSLSLFTFMHWRRKWQPTPVFLPGESQGWEAWWAAIYGVAQSWTRLTRLSSSSTNLSSSISNTMKDSHLAQITSHHPFCSFTPGYGKQLDQECAAKGLWFQNCGFDPNTTA